jgi:hypothetical protein
VKPKAFGSTFLMSSWSRLARSRRASGTDPTIRGVPWSVVKERLSSVWRGTKLWDPDPRASCRRKRNPICNQHS